ncbi:cytochrome P450 [Mycena vitilis]|nr:cytochrome P450 [Mycena vitilis]
MSSPTKPASLIGICVLLYLLVVQTPLQAPARLLFAGWLFICLIRHFFFPSSVIYKIPGPPSKSFFTGSLLDFHDPNGWSFQETLESEYGGVVRINGLFGKPMLFVADPVALHSILNKDIDIYEEAPIAISMNLLMFGKGIFSTMGDEHRKLRKMMVPAFSTANLRGMMSHFYEVAEGVRDGLLAPQVSGGPKEVDMASVFTRTSLELIGRSGLGYSFDPLTLDCPKNEYAETIKNLMPVLSKMPLVLLLVPTVIKIGSGNFRRWVLDNILRFKSLHRVRDMVDLMNNTAKEILQGKKAALESGDLQSEENMNSGTDIMSILLRENLTADEASRLTDAELLAQTSAIIFAAMDTTSSGLSRVFHVLASLPEVQERLRAEIMEAFAHADGEDHLDHDQIVELPYLDSVLRETLRLYPPVAPVVVRETIAPTMLPLSVPITATDGTTLSSIPLPKGTPVSIAIAKANHNPAIWGADALEFKPERWVDGRAGSKDVKMPGVWGGTMTFIGGGRSCIGFKFSQLEMKVVLCVLLRSFRFSLSEEKTVSFRMFGSITGPTVNGEVMMPLRITLL